MNDRTGQNIPPQPNLGRALRVRLIVLMTVVVSVLVYSLTRTVLWGHDGWLSHAWNDGAGTWFPYWIFGVVRWLVWIGLGGGMLGLSVLVAWDVLRRPQPH